MAKFKSKIVAVTCSLAVFITSAIGVLAGDFTNPDSTNNWYSRTKALEYMDAYAESPNRSEYSYFDGGLGGDCTNFVSQVLRHSGMGDLFDNRYTNYTQPSADSYKSWYFKNATYPNRSTSWTGAHEFRYHWANVNNTGNNRAYSYKVYTVSSFLDNFENIRASIGWGDVIQHIYASNGVTWHSQVVSRTGVPYGGFYDIKVAQHSPDLLERSLYDMLKSRKDNGQGNDYVCVIRIKNSIW